MSSYISFTDNTNNTSLDTTSMNYVPEAINELDIYTKEYEESYPGAKRFLSTLKYNLTKQLGLKSKEEFSEWLKSAKAFIDSKMEENYAHDKKIYEGSRQEVISKANTLTQKISNYNSDELLDFSWGPIAKVSTGALVGHGVGTAVSLGADKVNKAAIKESAQHFSKYILHSTASKQALEEAIKFNKDLNTVPMEQLDAIDKKLGKALKKSAKHHDLAQKNLQRSLKNPSRFIKASSMMSGAALALLSEIPNIIEQRSEAQMIKIEGQLPLEE